MSRLRLALLVALGLCLVSVGWGVLRPRPVAPLPALRVEVLNGCGVAQRGAEAGRALAGLGLDVVAVEDAESHDFPRTLLIDRGGKVVWTRRLAERIGPLQVVLERRSGSRVDCTLVLGADQAGLALWRQDSTHLRR